MSRVGWSRSKWRIRKQFGQWQVWRPNDVISCTSFNTFADLLRWKPDCERFLKGQCGCRGRCAR